MNNLPEEIEHKIKLCAFEPHSKTKILTNEAALDFPSFSSMFIVKYQENIFLYL